MHQIESLVDLLERHHVRNQVVDVDLLVHVPIDDLRHVPASARSTERRALPHATRHELERTGLDLLPGASHPDDHRNSPTSMTALQRLAHQVDVPDALEAVVGTAVSHADEMLHQVAAHFLRVHEVRHSELLRQRLASRIDVHADDLVGADQARTLDHIQPDAPEAKHDYVRAGFHLGGVHHGADSG